MSRPAPSRKNDDEEEKKERVQPSYQEIVVPSLARRRRRSEGGDGRNMYQGITVRGLGKPGRVYQRLCLSKMFRFQMILSNKKLSSCMFE